MKGWKKGIGVLACVLSLLCLSFYHPCLADAAKVEKKAKVEKGETVNAFFDGSKMSDMSDFDPGNPVIPTGDTIKIAVVMPFSGPAALNGEMTFLYAQWVAHDINKRGAFSSMARRSSSRSSRRTTCPSRTSARRSASGWCCRRRCTYCLYGGEQHDEDHHGGGQQVQDHRPQLCRSLG